MMMFENISTSYNSVFWVLKVNHYIEYEGMMYDGYISTTSATMHRDKVYFSVDAMDYRYDAKHNTSFSFEMDVSVVERSKKHIALHKLKGTKLPYVKSLMHLQNACFSSVEERERYLMAFDEYCEKIGLEIV